MHSLHKFVEIMFIFLKTLQVLSYLDDRRRVHKEAIEFCQDILRRKPIEWDATFRLNLTQPIRGVDLVVTIGGDGTLLQASHLLNDSIPLLGLNSDPTQPQEVSSFLHPYDFYSIIHVDTLAFCFLYSSLNGL